MTYGIRGLVEEAKMEEEFIEEVKSEIFDEADEIIESII